ncbi:hypothetical protein [Streptomyces fumanus]|uniref:Uncharacterized protein n=1 Tax=Streptomyces fumanus TaxID=67302 RepID=A0A919EA47_9ACTN|nr:hypothetical protein [Streptomyces fumanus]GHF33471.1 hypothetical protein GCM10018772_68870 [Streptomyces fumanus]
MEIPVPAGNFAEQLDIIIAAASGTSPRPEPSTDTTDTTDTLPNRAPLDSASEPLPADDRSQDPERLLVEVTSEKYEPATVRGMFEEAVPVCAGKQPSPPTTPTDEKPG